MFETIIAFLFGAFAYIIITLIPYIDSVNILLKITKLFSSKEPKGYRDYQKVRQSTQYKIHIKKWIKRKLMLLVIYSILFISIHIIITSAWLSMIISFITTIILMAIKLNKEQAELQKIHKEVIESTIV